MAWNHPLLTAIATEARRGLPGPRSAAATLHGHPALDAALAAAWETAGPRGRARIVDLQLSRGTPAAAEGLVAQLHRLDGPSRSILLGRMKDLHPALRRMLGRSAAGADTPDRARVTDAQSAINALWLIEHGNAGVLAYLALPRLRDPDSAVRDAAAACLQGLADGRHRAGAGNGDGAPTDHRATEAVAESLDQAVVQYRNHLNPDALRAWVAQGPAVFVPGAPALAALNDPEHAAVPALRELLKNADGPAVRRGLVGLLGMPSLALAAVVGLRRVAEEGSAALAGVLHGQSHLLDLSAVRRGIARGGPPGALWPPDFDRAGSCLACDGLPAWAAALPGSPREVLSRLGPLTADGPAARRLDALRRAAQCARPADPRDAQRTATPAFRDALHTTLTPLTADPDARIAAPAAACLQRERTDARRPGTPRRQRFRAPGPPDPHAVPGEDEPPRPSVARCRRAAARRISATAFEPLWHAWVRLPVAQRSRVAAAALRLDPTARERLRCAATAHDAVVRGHARAILTTLAAEPQRDGTPALHGAAS